MFHLVIEKYKSKKQIMNTLILMIGIFAVFSWVFYPTWKSDLDIIMMTIAQGVGTGVGDYHILFSNFILGFVFQTLYRLPVSVNWYYIFHVAVSLGAIHVIVYLCQVRNSRKMGWILSVVVAAFLGYECFTTPSYMKTSAVVCSAAFFLWVYFKENNSCDKARFQLILLLFVLAALISLKIFVISFVISAILIEVYHRIYDGHYVLLTKQEHIYVLVAAICIFAVWDIDMEVYQNITGWESIGDYRGTVEKALGFGTAKYDEDTAVDMGLYQENYTSLQKVRFFDSPDAWEKLEVITSAKNPFGFSSFLGYTRRVPISLFSYGIFYLWIVLGYLLLYLKKTNHRKSAIVSGLILFLLTGLCFYHFNALSYEIVFVVLIINASLYFLLFLKDLKEDEPKYLALYLLVFSVVLYNKFSGTFVTSVSGTDALASSITSMDQSKQNMVDLTAYFRQVSASSVYPEGIESAGSIYVSDGVYTLIPGFEHISSLSKDSATNINWIYNPKNTTISSMDMTGFEK